MRRILPLFLLAACATAPPSDDDGIDTDPVVDDTDVAGPDARLQVTAPAPGAVSAPGPVTVTGIATGLSGVTINGTAAAVGVDGAFSASIQLDAGVTVIETRATTPEGGELFDRRAVLAGTFVDADDAGEEGLSVRLNDGGLIAVLDAVELSFDDDTVEAAVIAANPVSAFANILSPLDWSIDIASLSYGATSMTLTPANQELTAQIPNFAIAVDVWYDAVGLDPDTTTGTASATRADVTLTLDVDVDGGAPTVDVIALDVDLVGFTFTIADWNPTWTSLLADYFEEDVEEILEDEAAVLIAPLLEELLADLELSFDLDLLGTDLGIEAAFADLAFDGDGLACVLDVEVDATATQQRPSPGVFSTRDGDPTLSTAPDIALALSDDLLNRMLLAAWRAELLDLELSTDDGSLPGAALLPLRATSGSITTEATLPPIVVDGGNKPQLQIGELITTIATPGGEYGDTVTVAIAAFADLDVTVDSGELVLAFGDTELKLHVRSSDWNLSNEAATTLLEDSLPIDVLLAIVGDFAFPLPTLGGLGVDDGSVSRDAGDAHTNVAADLVVAP